MGGASAPLILYKERRDMDDVHEIIITTREDSSNPRVVQFRDLFALREQIQSMMFIWNTNCYYVDVVSQTFIINGGRKIQFSNFEACKVLYRRRTQLKYTTNSEGEPETILTWLIGLEEIGTKRMVLLIVSDNGVVWQWANKL